MEQNTRQFPALHWYGSRRRKESVALAVANLDEALSILKLALGAKTNPEYELARRAIGGFLGTLDEAGMRIAKDMPEPLSLDQLRADDLPVAEDETFHERLQDTGERRRRLLTVLLCGGWSWEDVSKDLNAGENLLRENSDT